MPTRRARTAEITITIVSDHWSVVHYDGRGAAFRTSSRESRGQSAARRRAAENCSRVTGAGMRCGIIGWSGDFRARRGSPRAAYGMVPNKTPRAPSLAQPAAGLLGSCDPLGNGLAVARRRPRHHPRIRAFMRPHRRRLGVAPHRARLRRALGGRDARASTPSNRSATRCASPRRSPTSGARR